MKQKNLINFLLLGGILCSVTSCQNNDSPEVETLKTRTPIVLNEKAQGVAENLEDFYINFTTDMARYEGNKETGDKNMICSPLSAAFLFGMIGNGLEGEKQQEFIKYMGVSDISGVNELAKTMLADLNKSDVKTTMSISNSAWGNSKILSGISENYRSVLNYYYSAVINYEEYDSDRLGNSIKDWYAAIGNESSDNVQAINSFSSFVLLNAISFQSYWAENNLFNKENTKKDLFHGASGDSEVDMMRSKSFLTDYSSDDNFEYFCIPFGNRTFTMEIVLPQEGVSLETASEKLTAECLKNLREVAESGDNQEIDLHIPKFLLKTSSSVTDMLTQTSIGHLIYNMPLTNVASDYNGNVEMSQFLKFSIDEEGVKATTVSNMDGMLIAPPIKFINVDRPFYFFITEYSTKACVLSGRIANL